MSSKVSAITRHELVSENKRKQLFNQLVSEFRNTGKAQASSHGYPASVGTSQTNITASSAAGTLKSKKSHSIDKKGLGTTTTSSGQIQLQQQKMSYKKGKDVSSSVIGLAGSHKKSKSYITGPGVESQFREQASNQAQY